MPPLPSPIGPGRSRDSDDLAAWSMSTGGKEALGKAPDAARVMRLNRGKAQAHNREHSTARDDKRSDSFFSHRHSQENPSIRDDQRLNSSFFLSTQQTSIRFYIFLSRQRMARILKAERVSLAKFESINRSIDGSGRTFPSVQHFATNSAIRSMCKPQSLELFCCGVSCTTMKEGEVAPRIAVIISPARRAQTKFIFLQLSKNKNLFSLR